MSELKATCPICGREFDKVSGVFFGDEACKKLICPDCVGKLTKNPKMLRYLWLLREGGGFVRL